MEDHDQFPYDEDTSIAQAHSILEHIDPHARVLDLGCGVGRVGVHLPSTLQLHGVDREQKCLDSYSSSIPTATTTQADFFEGWQNIPLGPYEAILMLGNTLMECVDLHAIRKLFSEVSERLLAGGVFIIDDFPVTLWKEVTEGHWCDGIDEEGGMQMIWSPGEPIFTLRRDDEVDPEHWVIDEGEPRYRLWSMSEISFFATENRLSCPNRDESGCVLIMSRLSNEKSR